MRTRNRYWDRITGRQRQCTKKSRNKTNSFSQSLPPFLPFLFQEVEQPRQATSLLLFPPPPSLILHLEILPSFDQSRGQENLKSRGSVGSRSFIQQHGCRNERLYLGRGQSQASSADHTTFLPFSPAIPTFQHQVISKRR